MTKDSLGDRMKSYENVSRNYLTRRVPVMIRIDGKAFHTFTKGLKKPFDSIFMSAMQKAMKYLCENIQGCVFGYTQSDEISLLLTDFATIKTDAWFGYNIQKMTSVAASMATMAFNEALASTVEHMICERIHMPTDETWEYLVNIRYTKYWKAMFDARVFSIPKDEACNCFIWRQQDATRNSIESVGQANFSAKQLHGKSCNQVQDMLMKEKGINWNDYPTDCKRGSACYRVLETVEMEDPRNPGEMINVERNSWKIDTDIPIFTQDRMFIERHIEPWRYKAPDFTRHTGNALDYPN